MQKKDDIYLKGYRQASEYVRRYEGNERAAIQHAEYYIGYYKGLGKKDLQREKEGLLAGLKDRQ